MKNEKKASANVRARNIIMKHDTIVRMLIIVKIWGSRADALRAAPESRSLRGYLFSVSALKEMLINYTIP